MEENKIHRNNEDYDPLEVFTEEIIDEKPKCEEVYEDYEHQN